MRVTSCRFASPQARQADLRPRPGTDHGRGTRGDAESACQSARLGRIRNERRGDIAPRGAAIDRAPPQSGIHGRSIVRTPTMSETAFITLRRLLAFCAVVEIGTGIALMIAPEMVPPCWCVRRLRAGDAARRCMGIAASRAWIGLLAATGGLRRPARPRSERCSL